MLPQKKMVVARTPHLPSALPRECESDGKDLLEIYLTLPVKQRQERFADTAAAAKITGLTQRTIQLWIEFGAIRAIPIGRKYQIDLESLIAYLTSRIELQA